MVHCDVSVIEFVTMCDGDRAWTDGSCVGRMWCLWFDCLGSGT